jgi:hypothetical protein
MAGAVGVVAGARCALARHALDADPRCAGHGRGVSGWRAIRLPRAHVPCHGRQSKFGRAHLPGGARAYSPPISGATISSTGSTRGHACFSTAEATSTARPSAKTTGFSCWPERTSRDVMARYGFTAALLPLDWPLGRILERDPGWRTAYRDKQAVLLLKTVGRKMSPPIVIAILLGCIATFRRCSPPLHRQLDQPRRPGRGVCLPHGEPRAGGFGMVGGRGGGWFCGVPGFLLPGRHGSRRSQAHGGFRGAPGAFRHSDRRAAGGAHRRLNGGCVSGWELARAGDSLRACADAGGMARPIGERLTHASGSQIRDYRGEQSCLGDDRLSAVLSDGARLPGPGCRKDSGGGGRATLPRRVHHGGRAQDHSRTGQPLSQGRLLADGGCRGAAGNQLHRRR